MSICGKLHLYYFKMLANVFNSDVFVQDVQNSAALGSAYRAKHGSYFAILNHNKRKLILVSFYF